MNWLWFVLGIVFGILLIAMTLLIFSAGVEEGKKRQRKQLEAPDIPDNSEVK